MSSYGGSHGASYATLQDAYGVESFKTKVSDEMNGTFNQHPVVSRIEPPPEEMHNVYSTRDYSRNVPVEPMEPLEEPAPRLRSALRRRTTDKRHDVEPFGMPAFVQALPPVQQDILLAGVVGGGIYILLSLLE